jgi:hypothetical protein
VNGRAFTWAYLDELSRAWEMRDELAVARLLIIALGPGCELFELAFALRVYKLELKALR